MPKIRCVCDNIIGLGEIPSPNQLLIISDSNFDKYWNSSDIEKLYKEMTLVVKCNNCERLHIFYEGFNNEATIYARE